MAVVPKGNRLLGMDIQPASNNNYDEAFLTAQSAGMQVVPLSFAWNALEPSIGVYNLSIFNTVNTYYPGKARISLAINAISTNSSFLPLDLTGKAWNDPLVIARYQSLCNAIFPLISNVSLAQFVVGNEVDATLGPAGTWVPFGTFLSQVSAYVKQFVPTLPCGVTGTFGGYTTYAAQLATLQANTDFVGFSYYPVNVDYTVKNPSVVAADFAALVAAYPGRLLQSREIGYPTSSTDNSSLELQNAFIAAVFLAWDTNASAITFLSFLRTTDYSLAYAQKIAANYYTSPTTQFIEYLRTLGLRNVDDTNKPAWDRLNREAHLRGW